MGSERQVRTVHRKTSAFPAGSSALGVGRDLRRPSI